MICRYIADAEFIPLIFCRLSADTACFLLIVCRWFADGLLIFSEKRRGRCSRAWHPTRLFFWIAGRSVRNFRGSGVVTVRSFADFVRTGAREKSVQFAVSKRRYYRLNIFLPRSDTNNMPQLFFSRKHFKPMRQQRSLGGLVPILKRLPKTFSTFHRHPVYHPCLESSR